MSAKSKSRSRAEVSLALDRTCEGTLAEQLAERLRRCIANGVWKPGSVLPGIRELAKLCGTSTRVPKAAIAMLADENHVRYLAIGVLQELAERGISAPRDLGLVVCSNRGFAPVSTRSLTRFEWNAFADGERLAHRVIQYLSRGIPPGKVSLPVRYLSGRTF